MNLSITAEPRALVALAGLAVLTQGCAPDGGRLDQYDEAGEAGSIALSSFPVLGSFELSEDIHDETKEFFGSLPAGGGWHGVGFEGTQGQVVGIDALILNSGDLMAELYDGDLELVAANDDYDDFAELPWQDINPRFELTLPSTGTYYVVVREKKGLGGPLVVRGEISGYEEVEPPVSVFDEAWCSGPALTPQTAALLFAPGASKRSLGELELSQRSRSCTTATGCGAWTEPATMPLKVRYSYSGIGTVPVTDVSPFELVVGSGAAISLVVHTQGAYYVGPNYGYAPVDVKCLIGGSCFVQNPGKLTLGTQTWWFNASMESSGHVTKHITDSCTRIEMTGASSTSSGSYKETEAVWSARY